MIDLRYVFLCVSVPFLAQNALADPLVDCLNRTLNERLHIEEASQPPRIAITQENGSFVIADLLDQGIVHVATSAHHPAPGAGSRIFTSPMIADRNAERYSQAHRMEDGKIRTPELSLSLRRSDLGMEISDLSGARIARIRPSNLKQAWKGLDIETDAKQIYGLGEYPRGVKADEPWAGWLVRSEGEHGNTMSPFFGGAQTYTQFPIAFGVREDGSAFGILVDTPYKLDWDFRKPGTWKVSTWGDELHYFVFAGKDLREVHQKYLSLVGKSPLPPRGIFGNGISKFGYRNWLDVDHDLEEMHKHGLPVGLVGLDLYWFGGDFIRDAHGASQYTKMGTLTPDPVNFADFSGKLADLKSKGTDVMLISESYVNANLPEAQKLLEWGCVVKDGNGAPLLFENKWWGTGYMIDWTDPKAKEWIRLKYVPLAKMGVRNFWFDLGEPEAGLYAPGGRYHGIEPGKNNHADIHNIYNLMWVKDFKEVMDQEMPNERFYVMNRSGTSGLNRFGAGKWGGDAGMSVIQDGQHPVLSSGDVPELVAHLQNRIKNMPLVGVDYYTSDVGGFHRWALDGNPEHRDQGYTLWYANSALLDMPFRPHLWVKDGEHHYLPTETGHVPSNVANTRLRAQLEPYYYQAAIRASDQGTPIVAPLFYHHPHDPTVREMGHEAYIGQDLLMGVVANIYETHRNVYLPQGGWYDFHTNRFHPAVGEHGQWLNQVPVKRNGNLELPLFAREGAILPLNRIEPDGSRIGGDKELSVRVYGGSAPSETTVTEDDGSTRGYERGETRRTRIRQEKTSNGFDVFVFPPEGNYAGAPVSRPQRVELAVPTGHVTKVWRNGEEARSVSNPEDLSGDKPLVYFDRERNICIAYSPASPPGKISYFFEVSSAD